MNRVLRAGIGSVVALCLLAGLLTVGYLLSLIPGNGGLVVILVVFVMAAGAMAAWESS